MNQGAPTLPYWRLSGFYFFYFSILGALVPYWGPYLQSQGFSAAEIGELMAILHATRIVAPNLWGWVVDHLGRRMFIVRLSSLVALLAFAGVLLGSSYWWLAGGMMLFSFFWNASLPQFEANTMNHLQGGAEQRYSRIRLWGSVGFIAAVMIIGELIDRFDIELLPWVVVVLFAGVTLMSLLAPGREQPVEAGEQQPFLRVALQPPVLAFLLVCFLLQASHGPYYAFYSIWLREAGYSGGIVGALWALGVVAEIGIFLIMHRLLPRFGPRILLTATLILAALRWALIGEYVETLPVLFLAQLLHAATYGIYHAVGIQLVNRFFTGRNQGRGQALYNSATFGAGVALGSLLSGYLWASLGGRMTFLLAAALAALTALLAWTQLPGRETAGGPRHAERG